MSESYTSSSRRLMPWLRQDSRWKPIGQQHNLIFMSCFALTIYSWKWACGGRNRRQIHLRTCPGGLWLIKRTLCSGVLASGFIERNFLLRTPFLAYVCTYTFSMNPTHSFINETPGQCISTSSLVSTTTPFSWHSKRYQLVEGNPGNSYQIREPTLGMDNGNWKRP